MAKTNEVAEKLMTDLKVARQRLRDVLKASRQHEHTGKLWFMDDDICRRIEEAMDEIHIVIEVLS